MPKNILIFSDGTGQAGGVLPDEKRSNIYKLYRATRCGPDSGIDPRVQVAFYDPGIGTLSSGLGSWSKIYRALYNLVGQATGLGLTANIIDCYTHVLRVWEPGDRIFLFGFSRGAYTVRCLAGVLALCGVPRFDEEGKPLKRDESSARRIATEGVRKVYQHVSSPAEEKYLVERDEHATAFRAKYRSERVYPYFIGVFDTVASIAGYSSLGVCDALFFVLSAALGWIVSFMTGSFLTGWIAVSTAAALAAWLAFLRTHVKFAPQTTLRNFWRNWHFSALKMRFFDHQLNENVRFARHALAIDENRKDFARVPWASKTAKPAGRKKGDPDWLKQVWFAGNHSDIGGSYHENEARLSDIALDWMVAEATSIPDGISVDQRYLNLFPAADGIQHDECKGGWRARLWRKATRSVLPKAVLHPTVRERFELPCVIHFDEVAPYRPASLKEHLEVKQFYDLEHGATVPLNTSPRTQQ